MRKIFLLLMFIFVSQATLACDLIDIKIPNINHELISTDQDIPIETSIAVMIKNSGMFTNKSIVIDNCNVPNGTMSWAISQAKAELDNPKDDFEEPYKFILFITPKYLPPDLKAFSEVTIGIRVQGKDESSSWLINKITITNNGSKTN